MRILATVVTAAILTACKPVSAPHTLADEPIGIAPTSLNAYEASEFEPTWNLKLLTGNLLEFTQLDPVDGANMVTYSYEVTRQASLSNGWNLQGTGTEGLVTVLIMDVSVIGGCRHSATGDVTRDEVYVATSSSVFKGCGGPAL